MGEVLNTIDQSIVTIDDANDGGFVSNIVVDTQLVNGQLVPDQAQIDQQASVNSRNQ